MCQDRLLDRLNSLYPPTSSNPPSVISPKHRNHKTPMDLDKSETSPVIFEPKLDKKQLDHPPQRFMLEYPIAFRNSKSVSFIPTASYLNSNAIRDNFFYHNVFFIQKFWKEHLQKKRNKLND